MIFAVVNLVLLLALLYMTWDQNQRIEDLETIVYELAKNHEFYEEQQQEEEEQ